MTKGLRISALLDQLSATDDYNTKAYNKKYKAIHRNVFKMVKKKFRV